MKNRLANWVLKYLLNATTLKDVVSNDPKTKELLIDGIKVTPAEVKELQAEIKAMEGFRIYKLISETTKHHAEELVFNKSVTIEDVRFGKAMLYNLSLQHSIVNALKKVSLL